MIELVYSGQAAEVETNADVPFNTAVGGCNCCERYEANTNTLTLIKPGRYLVSASANLALPADGTVNTQMALAITAGGAAITGATMESTPTTVGLYNSVATQALVSVYPGCCRTIGLKSIGVAAMVNNQNLVAVRVGGYNV